MNYDTIRETVYDHVGGSDVFSITASERWSINMVRKLKEQRPDEVEIVAENEDGSIMARMPISWMRIKPKRVVEMTDEQRQSARERLEAVRKKK